MKTPIRKIIMLDTETLGKRPNAVVWQMAMLCVDMDDVENILREADEYLPIQPQLSLGRVIEAETMLWWMDQPDAARKLMQRCAGNDMDELMAVVTSLAKKIREEIETADYYEVFCRGQDFDFPLADSLFDMAGLSESPWAYNKKFDLRTTMLEAGISSKDVEKPAGLIDHVASHDCKYQVKCLFEARRKMRAGH